MNQRFPSWLAITCCLLLPAVGFADDAPDENPGPAAVIGLTSPDNAESVAQLTEAVQLALEAGSPGQALPAREALIRLGAGGTPGGAEDLERLRGLFQQGYLQSYSFEYEAALNTLNQVLAGLDHLPMTKDRWDLFVQTSIFRGIALDGLKDDEGCLRSFAAVLRTRPNLQLSRQQHSIKTIELWEKAKNRLPSLPRGKLAVDSEPPGATVFLDGVEVGKTPFIGEFYHGRYHLLLKHPKEGEGGRWIEVGPELARVRLQLSFEGALDLGRAVPLVRLLPAGASELPSHWWPWLGARLGVRRLVVVGLRKKDGREQAVAALVDLERSRRIREGWLERSGARSEEILRDARDLVNFLVTGRAGERLTVAQVQPAPGFQAAGDLVPPFPVLESAQPLYRRWWPYAIGGAACLAFGIVSNVVSAYHRQQSDRANTVNLINFEKDQANSWLGAAIAGYSLAGAAVLTGVILDLTYHPGTNTPMPAISVLGAKSFLGLVFSGRF